jgi:hypothetical protein
MSATPNPTAPHTPRKPSMVFTFDIPGGRGISVYCPHGETRGGLLYEASYVDEHDLYRHGVLGHSQIHRCECSLRHLGEARARP